MKITGIRAWQVDLPLVEGRYSWSNGNFVEVFDATVVAVDTDAGITGYGECTPLGAAYLPAYAAGVRAGLKELAPKLIGLDPRQLDVVNANLSGGNIQIHHEVVAGSHEGLPIGNQFRNIPTNDCELRIWAGRRASCPVITRHPLGGRETHTVQRFPNAGVG